MIKGYKAMNKDMTCRGFKFKIGKTYTSKEMALCSSGFHFCENLFDVYNYYTKEVDTIVCEVVALGEVLKEGDKSVTNKLKIVRRLSAQELLVVWIKQTNSGNRNSGNRNSGNRNSGNRNSGDLNSGNRNSGYLNSDTPKVRLFNKQSELDFNSPQISRLLSLPIKPILSWIITNSMTDQEKINNPSHTITGGFLRNSGRVSWDALKQEDFDFIKSLPNFDTEVFKTISGIDLAAPKVIKVIVEGQEFEVDIDKAKELGLIK